MSPSENQNQKGEGMPKGKTISDLPPVALQDVRKALLSVEAAFMRQNIEVVEAPAWEALQAALTWVPMREVVS